MRPGGKTEALRGLVDAIVLTPDQGGEALQIDLRGNLAAMLGATVQTKRSSESDDLSLQVSLVAGCRTLLHIVAFCNPFLNAAVYSGAPQPGANPIAYLQIR